MQFKWNWPCSFREEVFWKCWGRMTHRRQGLPSYKLPQSPLLRGARADRMTHKQCIPWSDCSFRSSLIWVCTVCSDLIVPIFIILWYSGLLTYFSPVILFFWPPLQENPLVDNLSHICGGNKQRYGEHLRHDLDLRIERYQTVIEKYHTLLGIIKNTRKLALWYPNILPMYSVTIILFNTFTLDVLQKDAECKQRRPHPPCPFRPDIVLKLLLFAINP